MDDDEDQQNEDQTQATNFQTIDRNDDSLLSAEEECQSTWKGESKTNNNKGKLIKSNTVNHSIFNRSSQLLLQTSSVETPHIAFNQGLSKKRRLEEISGGTPFSQAFDHESHLYSFRRRKIYTQSSF